MISIQRLEGIQAGVLSGMTEDQFTDTGVCSNDSFSEAPTLLNHYDSTGIVSMYTNSTPISTRVSYERYRCHE